MIINGDHSDAEAKSPRAMFNSVPRVVVYSLIPFRSLSLRSSNVGFRPVIFHVTSDTAS